jgi:DNA-binding NtrC family response regulator
VEKALLGFPQREGRRAAARPDAQDEPHASIARTHAEQDTLETTARSRAWQDPGEASAARPLAARQQARRASTASPSATQQARGANTAWPSAHFFELHRNALTSVFILGGSPEDRAQLARAFHRESPHHAGAFVRFDCDRDEPRLVQALQEILSAAGASENNPIRRATGGTLFLDPIASLSLAAQRLLLELISRTEGTSAGLCRWRLVTGSREELAPDVAAGSFLASLYDGLDKLRIQLGPGPA